MTRRTALSLIDELVEVGCLTNLTARRTARFWALPSLAARMGPARGAGAGRGGMSGDRERRGAHQGLGDRSDPRHEGRDEGQLDRIMAELDEAISGLDEVVRRAGGRQPKDE